MILKLKDNQTWTTRRVGSYIVWEFDYWVVTKMFTVPVHYQAVIGKLKQNPLERRG